MREGGVDGCGIAEGLVDDQVRDQPRIGVDDGTGGTIVRVGEERAILAERNAVTVEVVAIGWVGQVGEGIVGRAPLVAARDHVVVAAIDRP